MGTLENIISVVEKIILSICDQGQKSRVDAYRDHSANINRAERKYERMYKNDPQKLNQARQKIQIEKNKLEKLKYDIDNYNTRREILDILTGLRNTRSEYTAQIRSLESELSNIEDVDELIEYRNTIYEYEKILSEINDQIEFYETLMSEYSNN